VLVPALVVVLGVARHARRCRRARAAGATAGAGDEP